MKRIAFAILVAVCTGAHAESMYISDKLVVNVYAEANQESNKVATLDSGDAVETIEKVDTYTHVRLTDNREGWIKSSYLSAQVPAIVRLKELEKDRGASAPAPSTQLTDEIKRLKEHNTALQSEIAALKQAAQAPSPIAPAPAPAATAATPQGRLEGEEIARSEDPPSLTRHLAWSGGLTVLGGVIGCVLGYQMLARRIRRKYGNVKIY